MRIVSLMVEIKAAATDREAFYQMIVADESARTSITIRTYEAKVSVGAVDLLTTF